MSPRVGLRASRKDLRLTEELFGTFEKEKIERFHRIASGKEPAAVEGGAVLERLQKMVLNSRSNGKPEIALKAIGGNQLRKRIITQGATGIIIPHEDWLDLENSAQAELTSEDLSHPIESALNPGVGSGWRASEPGQQTVRLLFDKPLRVKHVHLVFHEAEQQRTHEFLVRWSSNSGRSCREIVRQQYNFTPPDNTCEIEGYEVDLVGLRVLEIIIIPDINGGCARASIAELRLA